MAKLPSMQMVVALAKHQSPCSVTNVIILLVPSGLLTCVPEKFSTNNVSFSDSYNSVRHISWEICFLHTHTHTHTHIYIYIYLCVCSRVHTYPCMRTQPKLEPLTSSPRSYSRCDVIPWFTYIVTSGVHTVTRH